MAVLAMLFAASRLAAAAPAAVADDAYRAGVELRRHGDDRGALREFKRAYATTPNPRTLAQIGLAEQALGMWADAEAHITEAISAGGDDWIKKNRRLLEQQLLTVAAHLGSLVVESTTPGLTIEIDGVAVTSSTLQRPMRVNAGTVVLSARAPGFFPAQRFATVAPGQLAHEQINLVPVSKADAGEPSKQSTAATATQGVSPDQEARAGTTDQRSQDASASAAASSDEGTSASWHRPAAWVALGLAAAALGTGVTFHVLHETRTATYNRTDSTGANVCNRDDNGGFTGPSDCATAFNGAATARSMMIVGYGGAALFGAATALLFWTSPDNSGRGNTHSSAFRPSVAPRARLACGMGPGIAGLACSGSF